jgi:hypothetical protein
MMRHRRVVSACACAFGILVATTGPGAQQAVVEFTNNFKYNVGQSVQPVFEGWSRVPDGTFNMHFGYLNRNWVEKPHIPVGPDNQIEPGGPDRGQPTFFYTRTNRNLFTVNVPRDWGRSRELVWTVTANGKTEKAVGWLQTEWEIDPVGGASQGGNTDEEYVKNQPPTLSILPIAPVRLPATATLAVSVQDDGMPKPRGRRKPAVGQETPPTLQGGTDAPVNVPEVNPRPATPPGAGPQGLGVAWIVWRGPAQATFEPAFAPAKDGRTETKATFTKPGEYVLRATANDGGKVTHGTVAVSVTGSN